MSSKRKRETGNFGHSNNPVERTKIFVIFSSTMYTCTWNTAQNKLQVKCNITMLYERRLNHKNIKIIFQLPLSDVIFTQTRCKWQHRGNRDSFCCVTSKECEVKVI